MREENPICSHNKYVSSQTALAPYCLYATDYFFCCSWLTDLVQTYNGNQTLYGQSRTQRSWL